MAHSDPARALTSAAAFRRTAESDVRSLSQGPDANPPAHGTRWADFADGLSCGPAPRSSIASPTWAEAFLPPYATFASGPRHTGKNAIKPAATSTEGMITRRRHLDKRSIGDSRCARGLPCASLILLSRLSHLFSVSTIKPWSCCNACAIQGGVCYPPTIYSVIFLDATRISSVQ